MEMKYYNPSNNFRAPIPREPKPYVPQKTMAQEQFFIRQEGLQSVPKPQEMPPEPIREERRKASVKKRELEQDDLLILGLIFLLLINSCDDYLLLFALGFLFFSGRSEN